MRHSHKERNQMASTAVASRGKEEVVRPLRELASLIKSKLQEAEEAAEEAKRPYWQEIGELLLEAKGQFDTGAEFYEWGQRQFDLGERHLQRIIKTVSDVSNRRARVGNTTTWSDAVRATGGSPRGAPRGGHREWTAPVDDIADRARRDAERIQEQELTRQQERDAEHRLALRLIDIGYKVLAKELHPDAGGSREAMQRLGRVRDRLKDCA
jgi:hypothetical protein